MQVFRMLMRINPGALLILFLVVIGGILYVGASTSPIIVFVFCICTLSLFFSLYLTKWVLAKDEGPPEMSEVLKMLQFNLQRIHQYLHFLYFTFLVVFLCLQNGVYH
jgi:H+-translocating diphosphatase